MELASRIAKDSSLSSISVISLDPGGMPTDLPRRAGFFVSFVIVKLIIPILCEISVRMSPNGVLRTLRKSAADVVGACFASEARRGELLYLNGTDEAQAAKDACDDRKRKELWDYSVTAAKIEEGDTTLENWR